MSVVDFLTFDDSFLSVSHSQPQRLTVLLHIHPLRQFLPPERNTPYDTRSRPHNYYLPQKFTSFDECNYMFHALYKHCY